MDHEPCQLVKRSLDEEKNDETKVSLLNLFLVMLSLIGKKVHGEWSDAMNIVFDVSMSMFGLEKKWLLCCYTRCVSICLVLSMELFV